MWRQVSTEGRKRLSGYVLPFVMQASWRCVQHIFLHAGAIKNGPKHTFCLLHHLFFWHVCFTTCDGKPPPKTGDFVATVGDQTFGVGIVKHCNVWDIDGIATAMGSSNYPPVNKHSNGTSTIWRCISYWKWGFSIAMFVYQRVPILGESNNTNFYGNFEEFPLATRHCLGWQYNDPWLHFGKLT